MGNTESTNSANNKNNNKNSVSVKGNNLNNTRSTVNQSVRTNIANTSNITNTANINNNVLLNQRVSTTPSPLGQTTSSTNNNNHIYTKMSASEYKEYQKFLLNKQNTHVTGQKKPETVNRINNTNVVQNNNNNNGNYKHTLDKPRVSSHKDVNDQFTQVTNDRIYRQPNAPYHPQPRMDISSQSNSNYTNVKDEYQNIYQQRQFDVNKQYLHTLHQNREKPSRNSEFERSQHEMERMKKQQSLLFSKPSNADTNHTHNNDQYKQYPANNNNKPSFNTSSS